MRILLLSFLFVMASPLMAFNVGPSSRATFGPTEETESTEDQQGQTYFSATKYDPSRWNKGVQTNPVQTQPFATIVEDTVAPAVPEKQQKENRSTKKAVAAPDKKNMVKEATAAPKPETAPQNGAPQAVLPGQAAEIMPADAAAAMAQLGQIQNMVQGLSGGNAGAAMPDISALMGGALPGGAQPSPKK